MVVERHLFIYNNGKEILGQSNDVMYSSPLHNFKSISKSVAAQCPAQLHVKYTAVSYAL